MALQRRRMSEPAAEPIRPAATVVLWRRGPTGPEVLMGMRGATAVFMPSKYVFPGGGVDAGDAGSGPALPVDEACLRRLGTLVPEGGPAPEALIACALRELNEETGLRLGQSDGAQTLRFIFRAITPPGRSRRFDARFFLLDADWIDGRHDDFSAAEAELTHLHWIALREARTLDLPFVTEVVLAEVARILAGIPQRGVAFFDNSGPVPTFRWLD